MVETIPIAVEAGSDGRGRILGAARQLFAQHGFTTVSMQQIADAAGVNKATLYHHFADKEALFVEVLSHEFARFRGALDAPLAIPDGASLRAQMLRIAGHIFASSSHDVGRLMADLRQNVSPERRTELMARSSPPWDSLVPMFERARAAGEIKPVDPALLSRLFFVMAASQANWAKLGGCTQPDEQTAAAIVDILLDGVSDHPAPYAPTTTVAPDE
jgi:AcrR family transcriptional regulator